MIHINAIRYSAEKLREAVFESYIQIGICANIYNHNGKQHRHKLIVEMLCLNIATPHYNSGNSTNNKYIYFK